MKWTLYIFVAVLSIVTAKAQEAIRLKGTKMFPQEKVFVMTDRDLYLAGDTARMRAWVYDCMKGKPDTKSKYVYVELRDAADNLKTRVKLKDQGKGLRGYLALPSALTSGDYTLAAYTYYMIGTEQELLFRKVLHVMNPKDVKKGLLPTNLTTEVDRINHVTNLRTAVPAGANVAMSITADRLCRADSTSNIVWALEHVPEVFMPSTTPYEIGQTISGTVYGNISTKKPQEGVKVSMMIPSRQIANVYVTGKDGRFSFDGFDLPDSTLVLISARKGKRTQMENIRIDSDSLPEVIGHLPASRNYFTRTAEPSHDMKIVSLAVDLANSHMLAEITVKGEKKERVTETYQMLASRTLVADELMERGLYDLEAAIMRLPGVQMTGGVLSYRGRPLRFFVDGMEETTDMDYDHMSSTSSMIALSYPMEVIERIDFIGPEDAAFLTGGAGKGGMAAICITLKSGPDMRRASHSTALKTLFPLGYQRDKDFQEPAPDMAWPVIYWNPSITAGNGTDIATIAERVIAKRRQAGDSGSYTVRIDGFTKEGRPIHVEETLF